MKFSSIILIIFFALTSCIGKQIKITKDNIKNDFWNEHHYGLTIQKMIPIDSINYQKILSDNYDDGNNVYLSTRLRLDSTYNCGFWGINSLKKIPINKTIYFNKENGWNWGCGQNEKQILGSLENSTWYKFSNLKMNTHYFVYVYVDDTGKTYQFRVNNSNF